MGMDADRSPPACPGILGPFLSEDRSLAVADRGPAQLDFRCQFTDFVRWFSPQFLGKEPLQLSILAQGRLGLVHSGEEADHVVVCFLAQRIGADRAASILEGTREIARLLMGGNQLPQHLQKRLGQPLPLGQNPLLEMSGQQLALIQLDRLLQPPQPLGRRGERCRVRIRREPGSAGGLELPHIGGAGRGVQLRAVPVGDDDGTPRDAGRLQLAAERGESEAEAVTASVGVDLRPENLDEQFSGVGAVAVIGEVRE
jgi:hypothetical protein